MLTVAFAQNNIPLTVEAEINALDENLVADSLLFANASGVASVCIALSLLLNLFTRVVDNTLSLLLCHFT